MIITTDHPVSKKVPSVAGLTYHIAMIKKVMFHSSKKYADIIKYMSKEKYGKFPPCENTNMAYSLPTGFGGDQQSDEKWDQVQRTKQQFLELSG